MTSSIAGLRRRLVLGMAGSSLVASALPAKAQEAFPTRPVRIVVPFSAGGGGDVGTRTLAAEMSKYLGVQVLVDNKGGSAGNIGMDFVAKAPKDGYTLISMAQAAAANPSLYKSLPFDITKDFAPIGLAFYYYLVLVVSSKSPIQSLPDLIAKAKSAPGTISSGTSGVGASAYFAAAKLMKAADIELQQVFYRGLAPALADVLGGHLSMLFDVTSTCEQYIKSGELRALAVSSPNRLPSLPDVPTLAESLPGVEQTGWFALAAPAGTPPDRIQKLNAALAAAVRAPDVQAWMAKMGYVAPTEVSPQALSKYMAEEIVMYRKLAEMLRIEPQ